MPNFWHGQGQRIRARAKQRRTSSEGWIQPAGARDYGGPLRARQSFRGGDPQEQIADPPTYTAIRTHLSILEKKGHVRHESDGTRYIYEPLVAREQMGRRAINSLLKTFFDNSVERAVTALLTTKDANIPREDLDRLAELIEKAKREGR